MNFYLHTSNGKIVSCSNNISKINDSIEVTQDIYYDYLRYPDKYIVVDNEIEEDEDFVTNLATQLESNFNENFIEIADYGWFRKNPKGYSSAVEAMNAAFNIVTAIGSLPANTLIFYPQPDFTNEEECTEDWLVANQIYNEELTTTEFGTLYAKFIQAWNSSEHVS